MARAGFSRCQARCVPRPKSRSGQASLLDGKNGASAFPVLALQLLYLEQNSPNDRSDRSTLLFIFYDSLTRSQEVLGSGPLKADCLGHNDRGGEKEASGLDVTDSSPSAEERERQDLQAAEPRSEQDLGSEAEIFQCFCSGPNRAAFGVFNVLLHSLLPINNIRPNLRSWSWVSGRLVSQVERSGEKCKEALGAVGGI